MGKIGPLSDEILGNLLETKLGVWTMVVSVLIKIFVVPAFFMRSFERWLIENPTVVIVLAVVYALCSLLILISFMFLKKRGLLAVSSTIGVVSYVFIAVFTLIGGFSGYIVFLLLFAVVMIGMLEWLLPPVFVSLWTKFKRRTNAS